MKCTMQTHQSRKHKFLLYSFFLTLWLVQHDFSATTMSLQPESLMVVDLVCVANRVVRSNNFTIVLVNA